jgi:hypothetical protein
MTQEELRLSPLGVLPQRDRQPRSMIAYTFYHIKLQSTARASISFQGGYHGWILTHLGESGRRAQAGRNATNVTSTGTPHRIPRGAANGMERVPTGVHFGHRNGDRYTSRPDEAGNQAATPSLRDQSRIVQ